MARYPTTPHDLDRAEQEWWQRHAAVSSLLDRRTVAADPPPAGVWIFELLVCRA